MKKDWGLPNLSCAASSSLRKRCTGQCDAASFHSWPRPCRLGFRMASSRRGTPVPAQPETVAAARPARRESPRSVSSAEPPAARERPTAQAFKERAQNRRDGLCGGPSRDTEREREYRPTAVNTRTCHKTPCGSAASQARRDGEVSEWLKELASKASIPVKPGIQGSNPCLSARFLFPPGKCSSRRAAAHTSRA